MLMFICFLTFWENSFKENIGKLCKIRVQSKQRFLQVEQTNAKVLCCDLKLELVTIMLYIYDWLRIKQKSKTQIDLNTHSTTKNK